MFGKLFKKEEKYSVVIKVNDLKTEDQAYELEYKLQETVDNYMNELLVKNGQKLERIGF